MKSMYVQEAVRKAKLRDGKSNRQIARDLGISRNTVRKFLLKKAIEPVAYQRRQSIQKPITGEFIPLIEAWLKEDEHAPVKQRHTAKRIYDRLKEGHGYMGSERRIREIVAELRKKCRDVFLPLAFEPGEMAQVDWCEVWVWMDGVFRKVYIFVMTLNYSGAIYIEAFDSMVQEAFFQGHANAFLFFGGVPVTLTYDNLKAAVQKILKGRNRQENERFVAFRSAYLFDSRFCNPANKAVGK